MPIEIDGFAVLAAIARSPHAFPAAAPEAVKTAKALVGKQLKDKALTIAGLRAVAAALGDESFDLVVDGLSDAEVKAMLTKVDKLETTVRNAPAQAQRQHLADLARGVRTPAEKPVATRPIAKPTREAKPKVERADNSKAMRAKKKG